MKAYGGVDVYIHIFLTSALVGGEWSASGPGHFTPGERASGTHWIGGWVGPRATLNDVEKRKFSTLCLPLRSQSLYLLCYPGSFSSCMPLGIVTCVLPNLLLYQQFVCGGGGGDGGGTVVSRTM
jgi:hypothetical protein